MNLLSLIPKSEIPPGGFQFTVPETGISFAEFNKNDLFRKVEQHYLGNDLQLPEDWKERIEHRICESLPTGWCVDKAGEEARGSGCTVTTDMILKGVRSLAQLVFEAFKGNDIFVKQPEAEARAEICSKCTMNRDTSTCTTCAAMKEIIEKVALIKCSRKTKADRNLKNCCKCGCRNEAIVHIKKDILLAGQDGGDMLVYPEWCWKVNDTTEIAKSKLSL